MLMPQVNRLRRHLGGPRRLRNAALQEVVAHLADATDVHLATGRLPADAARLAIDDFGELAEVGRRLTAALVETAQDHSARRVAAVTAGLLFLWAAVFVAGPGEPWNEYVEPGGSDLNNVLAAGSLAAAGLLAVTGVTVAWLRRQGHVRAAIVHCERAVTRIADGLAVCSVVCLGISIGLRLELAPRSLSPLALVTALAGGLVLVRAARHRTAADFADPMS